MKKFWLLFAGAFALLTLAACSDKEDDETSNEESYAAQAIIVSSDPNFNDSADGGTISFATEGGSVTVRVSCGCSWTADNDSPALFSTGTTSNTLTVTAEQNTLEMQLTGTVTLKTAKQGIVFATIKVTQAAYGAPTLSLETNEWNAPAVGELTTEIAVTASYSWTAESADSWLTVTKTDTGMTLTAEENTGDEGRDTKVIVSCNDGVRDISETVNVTQDSKAFLSLSQTSLSFDCNEGSATLTVDSNWDYTYEKTASWLTLSLSGNVLTVSVSANEKSYDDRDATVTFTAGDGAQNVAQARLTVAQEFDPKSQMIFTYTITDDLVGTQTVFQIYGGNGTLDWGDGTTSNGYLSCPTHTYTKAGEYEVTFRGSAVSLNFGSTEEITLASKDYLTAVKQWGATGLTDMKWAFYNCHNLESVADPDGAFAKVDSWYECFYNCYALKEIPEGFFYNCTSTTSFYFVFFGCESLTELPLIFRNCPNAQSIFGFVQGCTSLKKIPAGLIDDLPALTNIGQLFYGCSALEEIPAGLFDKVTKVVDWGKTQNLFYHCSSLKEIPAGLFDNFTEIERFPSAFEGCSSLREIPANLFAKCTKCSRFFHTFAYCTSLTGESAYDLVEIDGKQVKVHLYERENYVDLYVPVAQGMGCYYQCSSKLDDKDDIPTAWKNNY